MKLLKRSSKPLTAETILKAIELANTLPYYQDESFTVAMLREETTMAKKKKKKTKSC